LCRKFSVKLKELASNLQKRDQEQHSENDNSLVASIIKINSCHVGHYSAGAHQLNVGQGQALSHVVYHLKVWTDQLKKNNCTLNSWFMGCCVAQLVVQRLKFSLD